VYQERFGKQNNMGFKLSVAIYRKRNALRKIITTINEYRGHHVVSIEMMMSIVVMIIMLYIVVMYDNDVDPSR